MKWKQFSQQSQHIRQQQILEYLRNPEEQSVVCILSVGTKEHSHLVSSFYFKSQMFFPVFIVYSRVHITKQTLDFLGGKFEVEEGNGGSRDSYLADHKVESYLIVPPKVRRTLGGISFILQC